MQELQDLSAAAQVTFLKCLNLYGCYFINARDTGQDKSTRTFILTSTRTSSSRTTNVLWSMDLKTHWTTIKEALQQFKQNIPWPESRHTHKFIERRLEKSSEMFTMNSCNYHGEEKRTPFKANTKSPEESLDTVSTDTRIFLLLSADRYCLLSL